jgi:hypothetical protein
MRTDEDLRAASQHLHYEVWMFLTLARALSTGVFGEGPLSNAALESFTVHARALLEFFFGDKPRLDDVVADDFVGGQGKWSELRGEMPAILADLRDRVGTEVAHLTYARLLVTPETKGWRFVDIAQSFEDVVGRFLRAVPAERLAPMWTPPGAPR